MLRVGGNALFGPYRLVPSAAPSSGAPLRGHPAVRPADASFQAWLNAIASHEGTGLECAPLTDRDILEVLYDATGGPDWTHNENWLTDAPLGEWYGVEVDDQGRVVELGFVANGLTGRIPTELGSHDCKLFSYSELAYGRLTSVPLRVYKPNRVSCRILNGNPFDPIGCPLTGAERSAIGERPVASRGDRLRICWMRNLTGGSAIAAADAPMNPPTSRFTRVATLDRGRYGRARRELSSRRGGGRYIGSSIPNADRERAAMKSPNERTTKQPAARSIRVAAALCVLGANVTGSLGLLYAQVCHRPMTEPRWRWFQGYQAAESNSAMLAATQAPRRGRPWRS